MLHHSKFGRLTLDPPADGVAGGKRMRERLVIAVSFDPARGYVADDEPSLAALVRDLLNIGRGGPYQRTDPADYGPPGQCVENGDRKPIAMVASVGNDGG